MATDSAKTKTIVRSVLLGFLLAASIAAALGYTMLPERQAKSVIAEIRRLPPLANRIAHFPTIINRNCLSFIWKN